eukprot:2893061-Pyramimonas_sp.AAC.1
MHVLDRGAVPADDRALGVRVDETHAERVVAEVHVHGPVEKRLRVELERVDSVHVGLAVEGDARDVAVLLEHEVHVELVAVIRKIEPGQTHLRVRGGVVQGRAGVADGQGRGAILRGLNAVDLARKLRGVGIVPAVVAEVHQRRLVRVPGEQLLESHLEGAYVAPQKVREGARGGGPARAGRDLQVQFVTNVVRVGEPGRVRGEVHRELGFLDGGNCELGDSQSRDLFRTVDGERTGVREGVQGRVHAVACAMHKVAQSESILRVRRQTGDVDVVAGAGVREHGCLD